MDTPPDPRLTVRPTGAGRSLPWRWLWAGLAVLVLALGCAAGCVALALDSPALTRHVLRFIPGLQVEGVEGSLAGPLRAARVRISLGGADHLVLTDLRWTRWRAARDPSAAWHLHLETDRLEAAGLDLHFEGPSVRPKPVPAHLKLPLSIAAAEVRIGRLDGIGLGAPLQNIRGRVALNAEDGRLHRFDGLQAAWQGIGLGGQLHVGSQRDFPIDAVLALQRQASEGQMPVQALAQAHGPWIALPITADVHLGNQTLQASTRWTPFGRLPVDRLQVMAEHFDLQALWPRAPRTALSGQIELLGSDGPSGLPLKGRAQLRNTLPLSIDQGGVPAREIDVRATIDPTRDLVGQIESARLALGPEDGGSTLVLSGPWTLAQPTADRPWRLDARVHVQADALDLQQIHTGWPALQFDGPLDLEAQGLPLAGSATGSAPGRLEARATGRGRWNDEGTGPASIRSFRYEVRAATRLGTRAAHAGWDWQGVDLTEARIESDAGQAELRGQLAPGAQGKGPWRLQAQGSLRRFDLRTLGWQRLRGSAGAQELNASLKTDLSLPADWQPPEGATGWGAWLSRWRGQADLDLNDSQVAGLSFKGKATLRAPAASEWRAHVDLDAAGNTVALDGRIAPEGGAGDRWNLNLQAPQLAALAPLLQMLSGSTEPLQGQVQGQAEVLGRWPDLTTQGKLQLQGLGWGTWSSDRATAQWNLGSRMDAPVSVDLRADEIRSGAETLSRLEAHADGRAASHRFRFEIDRAARRVPINATNGTGALPPWAQALAARLQGQASLKRLQGDTLQWQAQIEHVGVEARAPETAEGPGAPTPPTWLEIQPFSLQALHGDRETSVQVGSTRIQLFGADLDLALLQWSRGTGREPRLDLQARLAPLAVAPLLARAQPGFGWGGDLVVGGQIVMRSSPSGVILDASVGRERGDLLITEDTTTQSLGLEQLRMSVSARDGVWRATESLSGRNLGNVQGEQTLRASPRAIFPEASAPLEGQVNLRFANLGSLGAWLPVGTVGAGWRLSGELQSDLRLSGTLGAPGYTGRLRGQGLGVRNGLEGVALTDGQIDVVLDGEQARVQTFTVRAGEGIATLSGGAVFGASPRADLKLHAERFAVLQRVDRRIVLSGEGQVTLDATATRIGGHMRIDEGLVDISRRDAPSLGEDIEVVQAGPPSPQTAGEASGDARPGSNGNGGNAPRRTLRLDVTLDAGDQLRLRGRGIDTLLKGELKVATHTSGRHQVIGTIRAEDGHYIAYGQKLKIDRGLVEFRGSLDNPRLDIEAIRPPPPGSDDNAVRVGVAITGTAQDPRVRLVSTPEMSETNKLSYLVLGRSSDGLGGADLLMLQRAAVALLAGEGEDPSKGIFQRLGVDELSVSQGNGQVRETIVKVGKQINERWYVGYERSLSATSGLWQVLYRVAQRFTVRLQSQQGEEASLDFFWTWRWE